jgi:hypothetical protein
MIRFGSAPACALVMLLVGAAAGAQEIGTVAEVEGTAEIGRASTWTPAQAAATIYAGEQLRTGRPGRMRVVLQDESVLNLGDDSHVIVDEQVLDPERGVFRSSMRLTRGKVRALVSPNYQRGQAIFNIETATAVSSVRGTEFIVVADPVVELTEVVGVTDTVEVHSVLDRRGRGVFVTAHEVTTVPRGKFPTQPRYLDEPTFRQYMAELEFAGAGRAESLIGAKPLIANVPPEDRAVAVPIPSGPGAPEPRGIVPGMPGELPQPDVADLIKQPPAVLQNASGNLGIQF